MDNEIKVMRLSRVFFGCTASPFLLAGTLKHHIRKYQSEHPDIVSLLDDSLYVDDLISGADNVEKAFEISVKSKGILQDASMNLRKWRTNSEELRQYWEDIQFEDECKAENTKQKVLGLIWNPATDQLEVDFSSIIDFLKVRKNSKRYVLQAVSRIFDPMGILAPLVVTVKCLLQKIWERGIDWDDELPDDLQTIWNQWCEDVQSIADFRIPRYYYLSVANTTVVNKELHIFGDSSEQAYGGVAYLRYETEDGEINVSFVTAKSRVAPIKKITLPRLELMGALVASRLAKQLQSTLKLVNCNIFLWTDSTIVLHWIRGSAVKWKEFVANRVMEIQNNTDPQNWSHCKGINNPADALTRGKPVKEIDAESWIHGPKWLRENKSTWQHDSKDTPDFEETLIVTERRKKAENIVQMQISLEKQEESNELLDLNKYSSLLRIIRITAWIKRFLKNLKPGSERVIGALTMDEIRVAELYWIKTTQRTAFTDELKKLSEKQQVSSSSKIVSLNPFLDESGVIRASSRLKSSNFSFGESNPCILPSKHRFTELIVQQCHERLMHAGVRDTLMEIRERYWVIKGRQVVKSVLNRCIVCKKMKAKPCAEPTAPLPEDRIKGESVFSHCGVDFAGPLYIKEGKDYRKVYITIFTCAQTRNLHLELVSCLSTEAFLMAFRRFTARRGIPLVVYSDNALSFKRADKDLQQAWKQLDSNQIQDFYTQKGIQWKFIVEKGPWWGAFYERLIRSVKTCLKKVLGKASLKFEELITVLNEVEAVLNSRPLTYVYNELEEPIPLTPSHLLIGKRLTTLPDINTRSDEKMSSNREELTRRLKHRKRLMDQFWTRWRNEYLMDLRSAHYASCTSTNSVKTGDIVLVKEDKVPRHMWTLGKVKETFPGRDGKVRACVIKLSAGREIRRPVQLLYPLEI